MDQAMKILYIGGAGRSGSTMLDMILGNLPGFFSIGEARFYWEYVVRGDIACGCGQRLDACDFWTRVRKRLDGFVDVGRMAALSQRANRTRHLPRIAAGALLGFPRGWGELVVGTRRLYEAVWAEAGSEVLVDASKAPSHAFLLHGVPGIDLRVLHLVRDGRAVAYSWSKRSKPQPAVVGQEEPMPHRAALPALFAWLVENAFVLRLRRVVSHYTLLRYEDFVEAPHDQLARAFAELGFDQVDLEFLRGPTMNLDRTHGVGGNPVRFSQLSLAIATDEEWRGRMSTLTKVSLGMLAFPLLMRFDYSVRGD